MIFDATVSPAQQEVSVAEDHVVVTHTYAIPLPMNNQVVGLPIGRVNMPMAKPAVLDLIKALTEAAEKLPDPTPESDLLIAQNLAGVEEIARDVERFKGA